MFVDDVRKRFDEDFAYHAAEDGRNELTVRPRHIIAVEQNRNDRCVRRRSADPLFFERPHDRRVGVARGALRKVLFGIKFFARDFFALFQRRQISGFILFRRKEFDDMIKPLVDDFARGCAENRIPRSDFDARRPRLRVVHLTRNEALPNDRIEAKLIARQIFFYRIGRIRHVGRADALVRVLSRFSDFIFYGLARQVVGIMFRKPRTHVVERGLRNAHGIGTHIRDETYAAFADVDAFVKLLRDLHGFARRIAEAVCGRLLQLRRRKRRFRFYRFVGRLYAYDRTVGIFYQVDDFIDFGFVFQFGLFTLVRNELSGKRRFAFYKIRIERPIFFGQKIFHFFFALADETKRNRLHAAGRKTVFHFAPQKRT